MIHREDMLELTRRMTPSRTSFTRIARCYIDQDGEFAGSFLSFHLHADFFDKIINNH